MRVGVHAHAEVWNLTLEMLGKRSSPELKAKAAETRGLLDFAVELLEKYAARFRSRPGPTKTEDVARMPFGIRQSRAKGRGYHLAWRP